MSNTKANDFEARLREVRLVTSASFDRRVRESMRDTLATQQDLTGAQAPDKEDKPMTVESTINARSHGSPRTLHIPRRLAKALSAAAAAAVVLAGMMWFLTGGPKPHLTAYAELTDAIANSRASGWVHYRCDLNAVGQQTEGWVAFQPYRTATKTGGQLTYYDGSQQKQFVYDPTMGTITVDTLPPDELNSPGSGDFFTQVTSKLEKQSNNGAPITKTQKTIGGNRYDVYTYDTGIFTWMIAVDPSLRRVVWAEMHSAAVGAATGHTTFDYPATGPEDIYALGAPKDARIVDGSLMKVMALRDKVEAARKAFEPRYFAIICSPMAPVSAAAKSQNGRGDVVIVYRKDDLYRIEKYDNAAPDLADEAPADITSLETPLKGRHFNSIFFCDARAEADLAAIRPGATLFALDDSGRIAFKRPLLGIWKLFTVEGKTWALPSPLLPRISGLCALEAKDGANGELEGIGWFLPRTSMPHASTPPRMGAWFVNPARDYAVEQAVTVSYSKDVSLTDAVADFAAPDLTDPAIESIKTAGVTEYAVTPSGRWYAKSVTESKSDGGTTNVTRVFLDTARELPDDLFDAAAFEAQHQATAK